MRKKIDFRTGSKETYEKFCASHPTTTLSFEDWKNIIYMYSKLNRDYILETGKIIKIRGFGEFTINKRKKSKTREKDGKTIIMLPVDWKKTKEKGKRIYLMNDHTEGFSFSWKWIRRTSKVKFVTLWVFKAHRDNKRLLAKYLNSGKEYHNKYCEWFK